MRIPKQFPIKGKTWKVTFEEDIEHEDGTPCDGLCDGDERTIYLDTSLKGQKKLKIFLHELFHAMVWESHIPDNAEFTEDLQDILAEASVDLLTDSFTVQAKRRK